jgi:hypothetical protein
MLLVDYLKKGAAIMAYYYNALLDRLKQKLFSTTDKLSKGS